jgi:Rab GTPase-binding effector protein 1
VLRSLVVPLEEEIKSLKEKLRSVHTELENTRKTDSAPSVAPESALLGMLGASNEPAAAATDVTTCDMCRDYESRLVAAQKAFDDERVKCQNLEKHVERMREDLQKESSLRLDLETQWQEKREEHKHEVLRLKESLEKTGMEMKGVKRKYDELQIFIEVELQKLSEDREQVHHHLKVLQNDNDMLSGKYLAHSQDLQDQAINLPDNVEELHEMVLSLQENLILAKVGCEHGEDKYKNFAEEAALLREQMLSQERGHAYSERELQQRIGALEEKLRLHHDQFQKLAGQRDELKRRDIEMKKENSNLRMQLIELTEAKEKTDKLVHELRLKEHTLQQELVTSEAVQQDFVRLSQNLQIQLEKFRSADMTVRWQFEDEVSHCCNCKKEFTVTRRKVSPVGGFEASFLTFLSPFSTATLSPLRHHLLSRLFENGQVRCETETGGSL